MALKDCIKKLGVALSDDDKELLQGWIDQGITDDEVLQRYELHIDKTLVDITKRAQDKGAKVSVKRDVLAEVKSFGEARVARAQRQLAEVREEHGLLNQQYSEITWVEGNIKNWELGGPAIDIYDDAALYMRIEQMRFMLEAAFTLGEFGDNQIKGETTAELVDSFRAMQGRGEVLRAEMYDLFLKEVELVNEVDDLTGGSQSILDPETGEYRIGPVLPPDVVNELKNVYVSTAPWKMKTGATAEGDLYISRHGTNAGTPHKTRQGPNDIAISFDQDVLLPSYAFYLLQYLQPQIAARSHGTAQQAVNKGDIQDVMLQHFRNQAREDTGDFYVDNPPSTPELVRDEAMANYKAIVRVQEEREINTGITKVTSAADAAHVLAEIRKNASEGFFALVLDKDDNVVGVVEHGRGTIDGTSVYPSTYAGAVHTIPGAAKVWMAHNHPSGVLEKSEADRRITGRISALLDGSGVEVMGHVLLGGNQKSFALMDKEGETVGLRQPITPARRNKRVKVFTRKLSGKQDGPVIRSPAETKAILERMGNPEGVLLLNNRHKILGFLSMTAEEMKTLKGTGGSSRLMKAFAETNSAAFIVSLPSVNPDAANNMANFANAGDMRMLDAMYKDGGTTQSMAERGNIGGQGEFFQQSNIGFTSGLLTGAQTMPLAKGPALDMLNVLKKQPGVTQAEIDWLDLEDWAEAKGKVTQQEMIDYIRANGIVVEEVQASDDAAYPGQSLPNGGTPRDIILKLPEVPEDTLIYSFELRQDGISENVLSDAMADDMLTFAANEPQMVGAEVSREYDADGQVKLVAENVNEAQYDLLLQEAMHNALQFIDEQTTGFEQLSPPAGAQGLQQNFGFSHFNYKNILTWIRTTERIGPNGERILMVEEIQSDWHQTGATTGYRGDNPMADIEALDAVIAEAGKERNEASSAVNDMLKANDHLGFDTLGEARANIRRHSDWATRWDVTDPALKKVGDRYADAVTEHKFARKQKRDALRRTVNAPPQGPFKGRGWPTLAMKRVIRLAAEEGFDQVAWTPGEVQNIRNAKQATPEPFINFYDGEVKNVTNKAARKLDKNANVRLRGQTIQIRPGAPFTAELQGPAFGDQNLLAWYVLDVHGRKVNGPFAEESSAVGVAGQHNAEQQEVHVLDISEQMRDAALEGQTLFQNKKGAISFDQARRGVIKMTEARDLSTFLHEAGHLYLEIMRTLAEDETTPQAVKDDFKQILVTLGVGEDGVITREHHELFARMFEKYLHEGNAPSVSLQSSFNAFRRWLTDIWKRIKGDTPDGIVLTPEIRDVMDRILASDDQIQVANATQHFAAIFSTAEQMGVSQRVFDAYKQNILKANNEAIEDETRRLMAAANRAAKIEWKEEKAKVRAQVEAEAHEKQIYKTFAWLAHGTNPDGTALDQGSAFKIDKESLLELLQGSKDTLARLPKPWVYRVKGGVDVDVAAKYLGYKDGIELIKALIEMPNMKDWITVETEARMQAKFPDPLLDGSVAEEAIKAVHNDRRASVLAAEMRELRRLAKRDRPIVTATKRDIKTQATAAREANKATLPKREEMALIKAGAKDTIAKMRVMDVRPEVYLNAERKAGRLAFEANGRGDFQNAYKLKRQQIVNYEMYRAAVRAKEAAVKTRNYLSKFNKVKVQQRLGKLGVIDPILAILEGIELRNVSLKEINRRTALQTLAQQIHDGQIVTPVSDWLYRVEVDSKGNELVVLNEAPFKNWQELKVEELEALQDIIKQLEHQGKRKLEMPVNGEMVVMADAALELTEQILEVNEVVDIGVGTKGTVARVKQAKDSGIAHWLGPSVLANILDKQRWGATTRLVVVTIRRAIAEKLVPMQVKAINDVSELYLKFYSKGTLGWRTKELRQLEKKGFATINGESLSKADVLFIAMNMGNEGNKSAIYNGVRIDGKIAYPEAEVQAALDLLDARDWTFVQAMWDYLDSYWPALSAMEKERRGIAPERVERVPFTVTTSDGETLTLAGGYMPLSYNYEHSERHEDRVFEDHYKNMGNGVFVSANTRAGATHNRVKNHNMVVQLGLFQIEKHLKEITRDIAIGNEVNFVKNLLNDKAYRNAMKVTGNGTALRELTLWLTDAAVGELPANNLIERAAAYTRVGFTVSKLAFNVYTTLLQFTGIFQSMAVIGKRAMTMGAGRVLKNPYSAWTQARDSSKFLQARYGWKSQAFDKDIQDAASSLSEYGPGLPTTSKRVKTQVARAFFWPIAKFQQVVDVISWWGAIWKARNQMGLSEDEAILFADSEVELAQTSGFFSDRSGIERGTLSNTTRQNQFIRLWTTLISYMQRKGGIAYMRTQDLKNDKGVGKATNLAIDLLLLFTLEGVASSMIYGRWDWDEDDPEELMLNALKETGLSAMAGIPFVRELPAAQFGSGNTPIGGLADDLFTLYTQSLQGDMDPALRKAFVNSMGTLFHLPASQTNRMLEALIDEDDPELLEYLTGTRD